MQQYREHMIPTHRPPADWWGGLALVVIGLLFILYGVAATLDEASDARVAHTAQLREQLKAELLHELEPTIVDAYQSGLVDGAASAGRRCKRGDS